MTVNLTETRPVLPVPAAARPVTPGVPEAVGFAIAGGSGVLVVLLVFNPLLQGLGGQAMTAAVLPSCVAVATPYPGLRRFACLDRASLTRNRIALFFVFSGIGVLMEIGLFRAGYHGLALHSVVESNAAKALSIVLASAFPLLAHRTWVFRRNARRAL
ncbi:GtrA family protein [Streptomyces sp. NPDC006314]|uniref:GtrA family protein n=1 Tax=Streptomyces sp. NPDC006314 TaxID=3154475 RepID=UPI0033A5E460